MYKINSILISVFLLIFYFAGCTSKRETYQQKYKDQDYIDFAKRLADSINSGNGAELSKAIDKEEFLERIKKGTGDDKPISNKFAESIKNVLETKLKFGEEIVNTKGETGYYNFVKFYIEKDIPHVVFRMYGQIGLNYHDFEVINKNGELKFADCYVLVTGENLSQTMRNLLVSMTSSQKIWGITVSENVDNNYVEGLKKVKQVKELLNKQEYEEALDVFQTVDSEQRKGKIFKLVELMIYVNINEDGYLKLLQDYERQFPSDPSLDLILIDTYFLKKEYGKAKLSIEALEKRFGKDPVLTFYKGNISSFEGKYEEAGIKYKSAVESYPDFEDAYVNWLSCAAEGKNYKDMVHISTVLLERFNYSQNDLESFYLGYPDFLTSTEYKSFVGME